MRRVSQITSEASDHGHLISTDDRSLLFIVRRSEKAAYVERAQPLTGIGRLSHIMRFDNLSSFDEAYETDNLRFMYPLVYWQLRRVVEKVLEQ